MTLSYDNHQAVLKENVYAIPYVDKDGKLRMKVLYEGEMYDTPVFGVNECRWIVNVESV